jgi:hypothetical protein
MSFKLCNYLITTFQCNGNGWRYEGISIFSFYPPMLEWNKLVIPRIFCCSSMCWKMSRSLIFFSPLLLSFSTLSNEVYTWKVVSPILLTMIFVSWSFEGSNLLLLVICFVILGSSTFGCSYGTSKICLLYVLASHLLGDGPFFILPYFVSKFLMHLSDIVYCNKVSTTTLWKIWTYTLGHECAHHWLKLSLRLFLHLLQLGSWTSIKKKKHHCFLFVIEAFSIVGH